MLGELVLVVIHLGLGRVRSGIDLLLVSVKLKQKWAKLTDDDLQFVDGKQDELLGRIQKRTGETLDAVEKAVQEASADSCCG